MSVKGINFDARKRRLLRAFDRAVKDGDLDRTRMIRIAFWRLADHIMYSPH